MGKNLESLEIKQIILLKKMFDVLWEATKEKVKKEQETLREKAIKVPNEKR